MSRGTKSRMCRLAGPPGPACLDWSTQSSKIASKINWRTHPQISGATLRVPWTKARWRLTASSLALIRMGAKDQIRTPSLHPVEDHNRCADYVFAQIQDRRDRDPQARNQSKHTWRSLRSDQA